MLHSRFDIDAVNLSNAECTIVRIRTMKRKKNEEEEEVR
jgi:hypothetical protein